MKNQKSVPGSQRYNPTTPGVLGQKVYCTHWMRTGECDFTQQGCMFLHAMPDLDTLELLGFRSYPRWFREMPRDYQLENATDFNEIGLNQHRHSQAMANPGNWHSQGNKYMPPRVPMGPGFMQYQQQQHSPMPGSIDTAIHRSIDSPWRNAGFNQPHGPALQHAPIAYGNMSYERPFTPLGSPHMGAAQPFYPAPEGHSIWSRDSSPNMGIVNRLHKPLSPAINSSYPTFGNMNMIRSPNQFNHSSPQAIGQGLGVTPAPHQRAPNSGNKFVNANPKTSTLFKINGRGRGREPRRQGRSNSPKANGLIEKKSGEPVSTENLSTTTKIEITASAATEPVEVKN